MSSDLARLKNYEILERIHDKYKKYIRLAFLSLPNSFFQTLSKYSTLLLSKFDGINKKLQKLKIKTRIEQPIAQELNENTDRNEYFVKPIYPN